MSRKTRKSEVVSNAAGAAPKTGGGEALPAMMGMRRRNTWRDQFNPLRGLTMSRAVSLIELGDRGAYADLQWLYQRMERSYEILCGLVARYEGGLGKLDWEIKVMEGADETAAEAQRLALKAHYDGIENLKAAIKFLSLARFRGYAHLEKVPCPDSDIGICRLEPVPQWHWVRQGMYGAWQYNPDSASGTTMGMDVPPEQFVVREVQREVDRIALVNFVRERLSEKDWDGYIEQYGIPPLFLVGPPNVPKEKEGEYQSVAEQIIGDARGYLPNGSNVLTVESKGGAALPFRERIQHLHENLVIAATGGKLTMLAEAGSGTLAGGAHQDAWDEIIEGEAAEISECFQCQIDKPFLASTFPGQDPLVYFDLCAHEETEAGAVVDQVCKLKQAGFAVDVDQIQERTGYQITVVEAPIAPNQFGAGAGATQDAAGAAASGTSPTDAAATAAAAGAIVNRLQEPSAAVTTAFAKAVATDLAPFRDRLNRILTIEDPEIFKARLAELRAQAPQLLKDINADPAASLVLADAMRQAMVQGADQAAKSRKP